MKKILFILMLFIGWMTNAQNIELSGKLIDNQKVPVQDVTVFLSKAKDSSLIAYTASDQAGMYNLKFAPIQEPTFVSFDLSGYKMKKIFFDKLIEKKDLGTTVLEDDTETLSEIVIVTDAPIRVKSDTLEFNASSFKVRPDANVEALLKELPGVEIDQDKKITVNGKEVTQILVNGKPFFNRDGSIALQNLPADLIKKVQVTDYKTKTEEFSGRRAQSDNASINLTIDEKNNKGMMGKIMGGLGTDERYEASGLFNYFQGDRKISVLAQSNNINSTGFSMDEIFDNMGGGRSQAFSFGGRSGGPGGFGSTTGITQSNMAGLNYSDQFFKDLEVNASYYLNQTNNDNDNRSRIVNLLPDGEFITESTSSRSNDNTNHNANANFEYKIDSKTKLYVEPTFSSNKNVFNSTNNSQSMNENGELFNESNGSTFSDATSNSFGNSIQFNKVLNANGKNLSVSFNNKNTVTNGTGYTNSQTLFYQDNQADDIRNQEDISRSTSDTYTATATYSQPVAKDMYLDFGYTFDYKKESDVLNTYDFDTTLGNYSGFNSRLSNSTQTDVITNTPFVGYNFQNDKVNLSVKSGVNVANFDAKALYMSNQYNEDRRFVSPYVNTNFRYSFTRSKSFNVRYNFNVTNPTATQILPYERLNDPLNTYIGNADLDQVKYHSASINFRNFNFQMRSGWSIGINANMYDSQIVSSTVFDENRKRTTTYENVAGAYSVSVFGHWNKSHKWDAHTLRYGLGMYGSVGKDKGFTNGQLFEANTISLNPRAYLSYDYGDFLTISPSYGLGIQNAKYTNYAISQRDNLQHNLMLQTTTYWPSNWTWGNDFSYSYNTNLGEGFKKDFFLWNTSLAYTFLNKTMTAKVKIYDILNQNQGISRSISATSISDQENTVLKRYAMFSLTWKFDKFGTGDSNRRGNRGDRPSGPPPGMMRQF